MLVLVVEPNPRGHHFVYVRMMLPLLAQLGARVVLVTSEGADKTDEFRRQLEPFTSSFELDATWRRTEGTAIARAWADLAQLDHFIARHGVDHMLLPDLAYLVPMTGPNRWRQARGVGQRPEAEVGWIRCRFAYPPDSPSRRLKLAAVVESYRWSPWRRFHTIDALAYERMKGNGGFLGRRFHLLPDPVDPFVPVERVRARRQLGIAEDGRWIGLAGMMDRRQGVDLLIRAFARARLGPRDRLLLAGRIPRELQDLVERELGASTTDRIVLVDRYVSDDEFMLALAAMDVVVTPYVREFGPSGVVLRAAAAGRPVLASGEGWLGVMVPRFGLGWTVDVHDVDALARGIEQALERSDEHSTSESARRLLEFSSPSNFAAAWTERLRERLGAPQPAGRRTWGWVLEAVGKS